MTRARLAVITGAARGIGEAIARRLHGDGYRVALADLDAAGVARIAGELGEGAAGFEHDVREPASWERLARAVGEAPYALVNNAARTELRSFWEVDLDEWDDVLATNLRGTYLGCRVFGASLREQREGRIVNLASDAAFSGSGITGPHYAASKAGILALTRRAASELAASGVTVNAVVPASIDGPRVTRLPPGEVAALVAQIPVRRLGRPEEVAALVAFLLSDEAGYITGATLDVDGGVLMR